MSDPGAWTPHPPQADDLGVVLSGHVLAITEPVGPYQIDLTGTFADTTLDAVGARLNGLIFSGSYYDPGVGYVDGGGQGTLGLAGRNTNNGEITTVSSYYAGNVSGSLQVLIGGVTSRDGVVIQQGVLANTGTIDAGQSGTTLTITGTSADAVLVNTGTLSSGGQLTVDVAVTGSGTLFAVLGPRDFGSYLEFDKAVGAGQTLQIYNGEVQLNDPINFRATVDGFRADYDYKGFGRPPFGDITLKGASTSAQFVGGVLSLMNGSSLVAQLRFAAGTQASDFVVRSTATQTVVAKATEASSGFPRGADVAVSTTGTVPVAPPIVLPGSVATLPSTGPDRTLATGSVVASIQRLDGYTLRLEGTTAATAPSLNESSAGFGARFTLQVDAAAGTARYGRFAAVGYNDNGGTILATGTGTGTASLAFDISDVVSPDGVTILAGAFNNTATIDAEAGGTIRITGTAGSKLINAGTIDARGMVFIDPTVTGTGKAVVGVKGGAAGSLAFGANQVSTGQSVYLETGTLTIANAPGFHATVFDFDTADTIVLKGVDVTAVTYDNGKLLLDGGSDGVLHVSRPAGAVYDTAAFHVAHSGADTILTTTAHS